MYLILREIGKVAMSNWKILVLAALVAVILYQRNTISTLTHKSEVLASNNSILVHNQQTLTSELSNVNRSIELLAGGMNATMGEFAALQTRVTSQSTNLAAITTKIQQRPAPVDCTAALAFMLDARQEMVR